MSPIACITARQREIVVLIARGLTNVEIAIALGVSPNTIKKHLKLLYVSLDVANRTELATLVTRAGMDPA